MPRSVKLRELPPTELHRRLVRGELHLRTGPVVAAIGTRLGDVERGVALHYANHPVEATDQFADFHISVDRPIGLRRWIQPQVQFRYDDSLPFAPLPGDQGFPMLEWGLNWCVSHHCHQYLILHAAVVERGGRALILPAPPGSGKSTLCAGLAHRGWRLMSDELTVIDPRLLQVVAIPRPVSLKNDSIDVIRRFAPEAAFGNVVRDTNKGSVAHFRPPLEAVERSGEPARPAWIVLPRWQQGAPTDLRPLGQAAALMQLIDNAFNYNVHGRHGFDVMCRLMDQCTTFEFTYSSLDEAAQLFCDLADGSSR